MPKKKKSPPEAPKVNSVSEAQSVIDLLWAEINDLKERLNQNSRNSSRPPSSDGPAKPPPKPRKSSGKQRGAQPGHQGHRRETVNIEAVDNVEQIMPQHHCQCGGEVKANQSPYRRHQVFDIPTAAFDVTEYQLYQGFCTHCGEKHLAELPAKAPSGQMGPNLLAYIAVQAGQFHQSVHKIQLQLAQNFGLHFSRGAISEAQGRVSSMLTPTHQAIRDKVLSGAVCYCDETRHQRDNERRWMWLATTDSASFFMTHSSRGQMAAKKLLNDIHHQVFVTDRYAAYNFLPNSQRQLCWAHILRDMEAIAQSIGMNRKIGQHLVGIVLMLFRSRHRLENGGLSEEKYERRLIRLRQKWRCWLKKGAEQCTTPRYRNRCKLLLQQEQMCWVFQNNPAVPLTNNEAERSLRSYVLWRKGSYGVRSHRGEQFRQRILSVVETARKLQLNPLEWVRKIVNSCLKQDAYPMPAELVL